MSDDKKFRGHPRDWQGSRPAATESMRLPVSQRKEITDERLKEVADKLFDLHGCDSYAKIVFNHDSKGTFCAHAWHELGGK